MDQTCIEQLHSIAEHAVARLRSHQPSVTLGSILDAIARDSGSGSWHELKHAAGAAAGSNQEPPDFREQVIMLSGEAGENDYLRSASRRGSPFLFNAARGEARGYVTVYGEATALAMARACNDQLAPDLGGCLAVISSTPVRGGGPWTTYLVCARPQRHREVEFVKAAEERDTTYVRLQHGRNGSGLQFSHIASDFFDILGPEDSLKCCGGTSGYLGHDRENYYTVFGTLHPSPVPGGPTVAAVSPPEPPGEKELVNHLRQQKGALMAVGSSGAPFMLEPASGRFVTIVATGPGATPLDAEAARRYCAGMTFRCVSAPFVLDDIRTGELENGYPVTLIHGTLTEQDKLLAAVRKSRSAHARFTHRGPDGTDTDTFVLKRFVSLLGCDEALAACTGVSLAELVDVDMSGSYSGSGQPLGRR